MALQFSRFQCRACGKFALQVRNTYDVPHMGYVVLLGFLSFNTVIARNPDTGFTCMIAQAAIAAIWAIHMAANWFVADEQYHCQACGVGPGE